MNDKVRLVNICPVFVSANVTETVRYYVEVLGFSCAEHYDKSDNFATVYRDSVEIVVVQQRQGQLESNRKRYGAGCDAYINTDTIESVGRLHSEYEKGGVRIIDPPHLTDYGSLEFTFEDIEGRIIGVGLIADNQKYFGKSTRP